MADIEHVEILRKGVDSWNAWRSDNLFLVPNLHGMKLEKASLKGANLEGANLRFADLTEADLSNTVLDGADLRDARLLGANMRNAWLVRALLNGADVSNVNLSEANLFMANFTQTSLAAATFQRTKLSRTVFGMTNLTNAVGLETCIHEGPSVLDQSTLDRSGILPLPFLRGCGLSDTLITYLPSLLSQGIEFYSCFISYSTKDQAFADRLYADLQNKGVRCWFAPHDMQAGKKLHEQIDEAIRIYDRLLVILSPFSIDSEWVRTEVAKARKRELREKRRMLFPVRLVEFNTLQDWECFDADTGKDSAREIREYYVPDFSNWKDHDTYQNEFDKLLRDLRTKDKSTATA